MVLLYGSDSWVVTGAMLKLLEGFHHRVARRIEGMTDRCGEDKEWEYPWWLMQWKQWVYGQSSNTYIGIRSPSQRKWPSRQSTS